MLNLRKLFLIVLNQWTIILVARVLLKVAIRNSRLCSLQVSIPQLTTKGDATAGKEAEGKEGISGGDVVDQGGVVPDQEDHGMVVVCPYMGVVAEVCGDQGMPEAPGEVVGQPQKRRWTWSFC